MKWTTLTVVSSCVFAAMLMGGCGSDEKTAEPTVVKAAAAGGPLFAQADARWSNNVYAFADDKKFGPLWCGKDISQCGSLITSVTTVFWLFGIMTMPDGSPLTPGTLNAWAKGEPKPTDQGIASRGYLSNGDLDLKAVDTLSTEISRKSPACPSLRVAAPGTGSDDEIRTELKADRPVILEVPGHWIVAVGLAGEAILIHDPFYADRKTLAAYAGKVKSSIRFSLVPGNGGACPK